MKPYNMFKKILGIFGVCVAISVVIFFQKIDKKIIVQHTASSLPMPIPTGGGDPNNPLTWSIYTFNHDFTLSYPPTWSVAVNKDSNGVNFVTPGFQQDDEFSTPYGTGADVSYSIFGQYDGSILYLKNGDQFLSDDNSQTMVVTHLQQVQIGHTTAVEFEYYPTDNVNFHRTLIAIKKGTQVYRFIATYADESGKKLFEEMVHSLIFLPS